MIIKKCFLTVTLCLLSSLLYAKEVDVTLGGVFNLSERPAKIATRIATLPAGIDCVNAKAWRWGVFQKCPTRYISALEGAIQNQIIFIPYSAFSDLANPNTFEIELAKNKDGFLLKIRGGKEKDASSYTAILNFDALGTLREKNVHSLSKPKEAWEHTTYKFERQYPVTP